MNKLKFLFWSLLVLSLFAFLIGGRHPEDAQVEPSIQEEYVPNEVLVKFKKDTARTLIQQGVDIVQGRIKTYLGTEIETWEWAPDISTLRSFLADPALFHIKVPDYIGTDQAIHLLSLNPTVEYAEKNFIRHLSVIPNDTYFYKLWGLHNLGLENQGDGTPDADIDAPEAWNIHTGSTNIVVAVIDSGINYDHLDLQENIWTNPGECGGGKEDNGVDDDGNGYKDDWRGWNFVPNPENNDPRDDNAGFNHGTHVAGTIGAKGHNNRGVVGVCWNVKLMALKAANYIMELADADAIAAIDYATNNGAHLSNNSYSGPKYGASLLSAIDRARTSGKLFIAAAGNTLPQGDNNDIIPQYPASYDLDNIISVLATDVNDNKPPYSHFGPYSVDVGAPGGTDDTVDTSYNIYSTRDMYKEVDRYRYLHGTSMATPHVAGLAALIKAHRPSLNWWQVKTIIMKSVDPKSSLSGKCSTGGRVNAYNALTKPTPNLPAAPTNLSAVAYDCDVKLTWKDNSSNEDGFSIYKKAVTFFTS